MRTSVTYALHPGETFEGAMRDDEARFGVTITPEVSAPGLQWPTVTISGDDDKVKHFLDENGYDYSDEEEGS